jgi:4-amino-4-deoxy-L-arabinose transferase-like glycosyltransferase
MQIKLTDNTKILMGIIFLGLCFRLAYINIPLLETVATRQCETASIARNFYYNGFNIFYPQHDHLGAFKGYVIMELGLVPWLASLGYWLAGGVHEWIGRLISILFSIGSIIALFKFVKNLYGEKAGLWAGFIFYLSPLSIIYTRTFQPESAMIFFTITGLFLTYKYITNEKNKYFIPAILCCSMAILLKITATYILLPITYLFWQKNKNFKFLLSWQAWLFGISILCFPFAWYYRGSVIANLIPNTYNQTSYTIKNWFDPAVLFSFETFKDLFEYTAGKTLTPLGFFFLFRSIFKNFNLKNGFIFSWLIGVLIALALFSLNISHKYYYLPLLVIGSIFIAKELSKKNLGFNKTLSKKVKIILIFLVIVFIPTQIRSAYTLGKKYKYTVTAGKKMQELSNKNDVILATRRVYYFNRKGLRLFLENKTTTELISEFNKAKKAGCSYFLVNELEYFNNAVGFKTYIEKNYDLIYEQEGFKIFKI